MTPESDGGPAIGRHARRLGVRVEGPIKDIEPDAAGRVHPKTGGVSVAPNDPLNLPAHRRPRRFGRGSTGHNGDMIFAIDATDVRAVGLDIRIDAPDGSHALIEPTSIEPLESYERRLCDSRDSWSPDEP